MWILIIGAGFIAVIAGVVWYIYIGRYWTDYRKARKEIFAFVESYKKRCNGNNRFVVTIESLQDCFREYDVRTIEKVWLELVNKRVIVSDPQDQEWCVR